MSANREIFNEPCLTISNQLSDFITRRHDKALRPLHFADMSLLQFSAELECYLSVLDSGGSIALCRGEKLASIHLSQRLETIFKTPLPRMLDGPQLTWTTIILVVGPRFDGSSTLRIGESLVELAEDDQELLRSGAPWRFLNPWPDRGDCTKELRSSEMTLQEIKETRQVLHQVLNNMSVIEEALTNHRDVVAQLYQDQHPATTQAEIPEPVVARNSPLDGHTDGASASKEEATSQKDRPSPRTDIRDLSNDQIVQSNTNEQRPSGMTVGSTVEINRQHASPQAKDSASQGIRLHKSDFIQGLSDILDDPDNAAAMRWSDDGRSISLSLWNEFPMPLLEKLSTKSYDSLIRRLYYYGFHKTGGAYHHDDFIRGQRSSIVPIRQITPSPSHRPMRHGSRSGPRIKVIPKKRTRENV